VTEEQLDRLSGFVGGLTEGQKEQLWEALGAREVPLYKSGSVSPSLGMCMSDDDSIVRLMLDDSHDEGLRLGLENFWHPTIGSLGTAITWLQALKDEMEAAGE